MITISRQMYISALLLLVLVAGLAMPAEVAHAADLCVDLDGVTCPYSTIEADTARPWASGDGDRGGDRRPPTRHHRADTYANRENNDVCGGASKTG